jgi:hypothetical protein
MGFAGVGTVGREITQTTGVGPGGAFGRGKEREGGGGRGGFIAGLGLGRGLGFRAVLTIEWSRRKPCSGGAPAKVEGEPDMRVPRVSEKKGEGKILVRRGE